MTHDITNLDYDLNDIYLHHPASLLGLARVLFEGEVISAYFLAVLQGINLFEVLYIIALSLGVMALFDFKFGKSIKFVLGSYGIGFLMWIVTLMFLMVTMARVQ